MHQPNEAHEPAVWHIDLAKCGNRYYFLEINPTGEWAWLVDELGFPIDEALADELVGPPK